MPDCVVKQRGKRPGWVLMNLLVSIPQYGHIVRKFLLKNILALSIYIIEIAVDSKKASILIKF